VPRVPPAEESDEEVEAVEDAPAEELSLKQQQQQEWTQHTVKDVTGTHTQVYIWRH